MRGVGVAVLVLAAGGMAAQTATRPEVRAYPAEGPLAAQVQALLAEPDVAEAHWGIAVTAMDGTPIYGLDEGKLFRPASTAKLFTTAAAMAMLGPETTVSTKVEFESPGPDGASPNNLYLYGAGDANFSDTEFPYRAPAQQRAEAAAAEQPLAPPDPLRYFDELAADVARDGVKRIDGNVIGVDTWAWEPYPEGWEIEDMTWGYGAPGSSLSVEDNEIELKIVAGEKTGDRATYSMTPAIPYYQVEMNVVTVAAGTPARIGVARAPGSRVLRAYGTIAAGGRYSTEIAIDDPAEFAALALKQTLEAQGIVVAGKALADHRPLADTESFYRESHEPLVFGEQHPADLEEDTTAVCISGPRCPYWMSAAHRSPTLAEDVAYTLKVSQNLHAEMLLRRLGGAYGRLGYYDGDDSLEAQGARVVRQWLLHAGLSGDDFVFYDGSGLSAKDLVAPRAETELLAYAAKQPWFAAWKAALPVGGIDGTLAARFMDAPLKGRVFAKTGTLGESRALAGYVTCASGRQVIFSVMVDDHRPGGQAARRVMDEIVAAVARSE